MALYSKKNTPQAALKRQTENRNESYQKNLGRIQKHLSLGARRKGGEVGEGNPQDGDVAKQEEMDKNGSKMFSNKRYLMWFQLEVDLWFKGWLDQSTN